MTEPAQAAIVTFTNNGDQPLYISVSIGGADHEIAVLEQGDSIRQVTPGHVDWKFSNNAPDDSAATDTADESATGTIAAPSDGDDKGGGGKRGV